ncbi:MAG: response regulator [bacterium]|nr:response regulator [bacterium]
MKKTKILIVEDDEQFRNLLQRFLEATCTVLTAVNGEEGFALAKTELPDLIMTDILMPIKTGVELIRDLRDDKITKNIPIIILLATAYTQDLKAAQSFNPDSVLRKEQVTRKVLFDLIEKFVPQK